MELTHSGINGPGYIEYPIDIDVKAAYLLCDFGVALSSYSFFEGANVSPALPDGVYQHGPARLAVFSMGADGAYPFHEADEIEDPDTVLLNCVNYFSEDEPLDHCLIDSGSVVFMPVSCLPQDLDPYEVGPVIDFSRYEPWEMSVISIFASKKGIYIYDYFLVRDLSGWR